MTKQYDKNQIDCVFGKKTLSYHKNYFICFIGLFKWNFYFHINIIIDIPSIKESVL